MEVIILLQMFENWTSFAKKIHVKNLYFMTDLRKTVLYFCILIRKNITDIEFFFSSSFFRHNNHDSSTQQPIQPVGGCKQVHRQTKGKTKYTGPMWLQHPPPVSLHRMSPLFKILFPRFSTFGGLKKD